MTAAKNKDDKGIFLRPGSDRMKKLRDEKKRILNDDDEDLSIQDIIYRLIDNNLTA